MSWTAERVAFLSTHYPTHGLKWTASALGVSLPAIRMKACRLGLKQDRTSNFFIDWQRRAAIGKVGKKRPDQAEVMRRLHQEGRFPWTPARRSASSAAQKARLAANGHPRGATGMIHSAATRALISQSSRKTWAGMSEKQKMDRTRKQLETSLTNGTYVRPRHKTTWKAAWRDIGGKNKFFRSRWEANYARYLEWLKGLGQITDWHHEPEVFWFDGVKRGCVSYLPDFRVINHGGEVEYHEVKGWMDDRSKTKIRRMAKYHPKVKLVVVAAKQYKEISRKVSGLVPGWES